MKLFYAIALNLFSLIGFGQNNPDFYVTSNGVTCMCPDANFGDTGTLTINGETKTFTKRTRTELDALIQADELDPQIALSCTSGITDMSQMFFFAELFNQDIGSWDTSNVIDMGWMFSSAAVFNQNISLWDTSNVNDIEGMFFNAVSFNQNISTWDVSSVTDMGVLFFNADSFNQNIENWDVSSVINMYGVFRNNSAFNQPIGNWDTSNVTVMIDMFKDAISFNQDISNWCVEQIDSEPLDFSYNSPLQDNYKPNWGVTCTLDVQDNSFTMINLYPNPVIDRFRLEVSDNISIKQISIYSIDGRLIDDISYKSEPINISSLESGMYILKIKSNDGDETFKRIVKR